MLRQENDKTCQELNVKVIKMFFYLCICLALCLGKLVNAEQISFSKRLKDDFYQFDYQWLDHNKEQQSMSFTLAKTALFQRFRLLKGYQGNFAQRSIMRKVKEQLKNNPLQGAQAVFLKQNKKITIQVKGLKEEDVAAAYAKVKELEQEATLQYFKNNYYQMFTTPDHVAGVKMDHVAIANDSVSDFKILKSVILEQVSIKNIRKVTNYVLSFVQSIPYSTLESRVTSSGSGFNPPAKLLWENQGDCDSKVTLTATILRALMPRIEMAMVYIDQHAFIGIAVPATAGEMTIEYQGVNYLLAEPTGPAPYVLGKIAPESELAINQGRYVAEQFHYDGNLNSGDNLSSDDNL